jgi:decaprenylphospho-beta-D-ribofuranose 2-oxidase
MIAKKAITDWGKYPVVEAEFMEPVSPEKFTPDLSRPLIARGLGRCYGDSALGERIVSTLNWNKLLAFDRNTVRLTCESGVSFDEIIRTFLPRGFFLPVTPGTKYITVGGAIAGDIHGKNHHCEGTFSRHVESFDLLTGEGIVKTCSRTENTGLFWATCGGMGLTGIILRASFFLKRVETAYIRQKSIKARNLDHILDLFEEYSDYTYSVSWIDCLARGNNMGRSLLYLGEHALSDELNAGAKKHPLLLHREPRLQVPFDFPSFALNRFSVKAFNFLYYHKAPSGQHDALIHYDPYFYPLDSVLHWNRIYGKRGFTQYQFVIPREGGREGMKRILKRIADSGLGSFLAVLKVFGKEEARYLLFPAEGYTLALDFPITQSLFPLLDELDREVTGCGGKIYLNKDVRLKPDAFSKMYPKEEFSRFRKENMAAGVFESRQSLRVFGNV